MPVAFTSWPRVAAAWCTAGRRGPCTVRAEPTIAGLWYASHGRPAWLAFACHRHADDLIAPRTLLPRHRDVLNRRSEKRGPNWPDAGPESRKVRSVVNPGASRLSWMWPRCRTRRDPRVPRDLLGRLTDRIGRRDQHDDNRDRRHQHAGAHNDQPATECHGRRRGSRGAWRVGAMAGYSAPDQTSLPPNPRRVDINRTDSVDATTGAVTEPGAVHDPLSARTTS